MQSHMRDSDANLTFIPTYQRKKLQCSSILFVANIYHSTIIVVRKEALDVRVKLSETSTASTIVKGINTEDRG